jgi:phosphoglucosamine mutase
VITIGVAPDGVNINAGRTRRIRNCCSVVMHGADIGIALDGDADRVRW